MKNLLSVLMVIIWIPGCVSNSLIGNVSENSKGEALDVIEQSDNHIEITEDVY